MNDEVVASTPALSTTCWKCGGKGMLVRHPGSYPRPTRMWTSLQAPEAMNQCRNCKVLEDYYEFGHLSMSVPFKLVSAPSWRDSSIHKAPKQGALISQRFIYVI